MIKFVSYPRCGSHYLRSLMEDYSGMRDCRWSSINEGDHWCYHYHDRIPGCELGDKISGKVMLLYRDPVDVTFSQMKYHASDNWGPWSDEYLAHCKKWFRKNIADEKFVIRYEDLTSCDMTTRIKTFFDMLDFIDLGIEKDEEKLTQVFSSTTYDRVRKKKKYDDRVVRGDYGEEKPKFRDQHGDEIYLKFKDFEEFRNRP